MTGEWTNTTLGGVTDFLSGGTPSKDRADFWGGSIPWVSAKDMKRFRLDDTQDHVTEEGAANGTRLIPSGTVLMLARGMTLLNDLPICIANRPMTFNQDVKALRPTPNVRDDFLPYLLLGNKERLLSLVDLAGHGTGRLNSDELKALDVSLPPEREQRAIAHILGTLDDKIELNRRMNETLEALARTLFKAWFVDFDPVRANAEGRETGLAPEFRTIFPGRLISTSEGDVPEGWTRAGIGTWVGMLSGGTPSRENAELWAGSIPWISPKVMTEIHADDAEEYVTDKALGAGTRLASSGCTLVMVRGMGLHERVRVSQARRDVAFNQDVKALVPQRIHPSLLLFAMLDAQGELLGRVESSGHGTGKLATDVLRSHPVAMPGPPLQARLGSVFDNINARIGVVRDESRSLAALRDALLPKLISGELRVDAV
jgi:type I restriction enzyme S subunit